VFEQYAEAIGLDENAWNECYDDQRPLPKISASAAQGAKLGVNQTPTFFIGDQKIPGAISYDQLKAYVDSAASKARADTTVRRIPG
jgi:protein-disulfide isomerase